MRCRVRLQPKDEIDKEAIQMLLAAAENSCVVMQTLRDGVTVQTELETGNVVAAETAAANS